MHGHFTLNGAGAVPLATGTTTSTPAPTAAPQGTALEVLVDAHTGRTEAVALSNAAPATPLAKLGTVASLP
jgi:hypothetical protein